MWLKSHQNPELKVASLIPPQRENVGMADFAIVCQADGLSADSAVAAALAKLAGYGPQADG